MSENTNHEFEGLRYGYHIGFYEVLLGLKEGKRKYVVEGLCEHHKEFINLVIYTNKNKLTENKTFNDNFNHGIRMGIYFMLHHEIHSYNNRITINSQHIETKNFIKEFPKPKILTTASGKIIGTFEYSSNRKQYIKCEIKSKCDVCKCTKYCNCFLLNDELFKKLSFCRNCGTFFERNTINFDKTCDDCGGFICCGTDTLNEDNVCNQCTS